MVSSVCFVDEKELERRIEDISRSCRSQVPDQRKTKRKKCLSRIFSIELISFLVTLTNEELRTIENDPNSSSILSIYRSSKSLFDVRVSFSSRELLIHLFFHLDSGGLCSPTKTTSNSPQ